MARPIKTGLNYFPLEVDFFNDPRISAVTVVHGIKGQAAVIMLLCAIYRNGYYFEWTPENYVVLLKELPGITINEMKEIIDTLVKWEFFDRALFEQQQVLTSRDIQQHFIVAARRRKHTTDKILKYWLLTEGTPKMSAETSKMTTETPQEDNIKINKINPSSCSSSCAREVDIKQMVRQMKENEAWIEIMCMKHHLDKTQLTQFIDEFATDCQCRGNTTHESIGIAQNHFCNWLLVKQRVASQQKTQSLKTNYHGNNYQQRTSADYIREAQQWAIEQSLQAIRAPRNRGTEVQGPLPF